MNALMDKIPLPRIARRYIWYIVSFGVSVGIGVAPFLGLKKVPGFQALLDLFPMQLQEILIPASMFLMGLVGVVVHFYAGQGIKMKVLNRFFLSGFAALLVTLLIFLRIYMAFVVRVESKAMGRTIAVLVGTSYDKNCDCYKRNLKRKECIKWLSFDDSLIEACWEENQIQQSGYWLAIPYLALMGGFGGLIGLVIRREELRREKRKKPSNGAASRSSTDASAQPARRSSPKARKTTPKSAGEG